MKLKHQLLSLSLLTVFLIGAGCQRMIKNQDITPNAATSAPAGKILVAASLSSIAVLEGFEARIGAMFAQQFRGVSRQHQNYDSYRMTSDNFSWTNPYYGVVAQCDEVITRAGRLNNRTMQGIAKVLKAQIIGTMASLYGDVPFSQVNQTGVRAPALETQTQVYTAVQVLLTEAIGDLSANVGAVDNTSDIFFSGNRARWIAAANTLKARFFLHVNDYANAITSANLGIASVAGNLLAPHTGGVQDQDMNLWYNFLVIQRGGDYAGYDAFGAILLDPTKGARYRGNAKTNETARFNFIYVPETAPGAQDYEININTGGIFASNASFPLASYEENQLIIAESQIRLNNTAAAITALNNVRTALATQYPTGTYTAYVLADFQTGGMARTAAATSDNNAILREIIEEKYCTLTGQVEVFNDLRRTNNLIGITPVTGTELPQRFIYPLDEANANPNIPTPLPSLFERTRANGGSR